MSRSQRLKGQKGEREAIAFFRAFGVAPDCESARAACRGGGEDGRIRGRDVVDTPGLCVQVKLRNNPDPVSAIREAEKAATDGELPIAYVRRTTHQKPIACIIMRAEDWALWWHIVDRFTLAFPRRVAEIRAQLTGENDG